MRVTVLGSGSSGNSIHLQSGETALLIDAGFTCIELERRMHSAHLSPSAIIAIVISHEHTDHIKGAEVFSRKYKVPIYMSEGTASASMINKERAFGIVKFEVGKEFSVDGISINPFRIAHDAADPCAFVVKGNGNKIGIGTDLGYVTKLIEDKFRALDLLIFESNYDPEMLMSGPYPWFLKQRIASRNGHLSNPESAEFVRSIITSDTRHLLLAHMSRTNNTPLLALTTCAEALASAGNTITKPILTSQYVCARAIDLEAE